MKRTTIALVGISLVQWSFAQTKNWQNKDLLQNKFFGISTEKAYQELLIGKKTQKVIVAIVDSGIDTLQEELTGHLWTDSSEGSHGWSYIDGTETGQEDITRIISGKKDFYDSLSYLIVPDEYRERFSQFRVINGVYEDKIATLELLINEMRNVQQIADEMVRNMRKENPSLSDFEQYAAHNEDEQKIKELIISDLCADCSWKTFRDQRIVQLQHLAAIHISHGLNRSNVEADTARGTADVSPDPLALSKQTNNTSWHGTHVAGIIAASRNNAIEMNGVANNVEVMMLKAVGNIRELRDRHLASAIRFAVDHGARIINLSFGKSYTINKSVVDKAVQYAMEHDVLLVRAAGNDHLDLDKASFFPSRVYEDGSRAAAFLIVGASGPNDDSTLAAKFSNYGASSVDVFAPGVDIYSTIPGNRYASWSGTSMAAPVVAGLAALIREYYPKLTAVQVKDIIMKSVVKRDILKDKCVSGGIVNAYNALKLAAGYK